MSTTRHEFIRVATAASLLPLAGSLSAAAIGPTANKLSILILGGTGFIGPYVVREALRRGHSVTLFNRGRSNTDLFPDLETLLGDRDPEVGAGLNALQGRRWDVCIDNTGYIPRHVRASVTLLRDGVARYLFTSTRKVYADFLAPDKREDAPRAKIDDPGSEDRRRHYGPLKALCEDAVTETFGARSSIVRPTAVAGPGDRSDRFSYWTVRINRGGNVLAPGDVTDPIQYIDVRDLAEFTMRLVEDGQSGPFNVAGPHADLGVAEFLHGCRAITSAPVTFTWASAEFLAQHGLTDSMPLWNAPKITGETRSPINRDRAIAHGLAFRPLAVTARDTLDWFLSQAVDQQRLKQGPTAAQEQAVLAAWATA